MTGVPSRSIFAKRRLEPALALALTMLVGVGAVAQRPGAEPSPQQGIKGGECPVKPPAIEAQALSSARPKIKLALARSYARCGQLREAIAGYRQYLYAKPRQTAVWYEFGVTLARDGETEQAVNAFERMLRLDPGNLGGEIGLAESEAALGRYHRALRLYDKALSQTPGQYDALQGKAFVLYWTGHFSRSQAIFKQLTIEKPGDTENRIALRSIARALDAKRWAALRPVPDAPAHAWITYYRGYLAGHPDDAAAMEGLARAEAELGNYEGAVRDDQRALRLNPSSLSAQEHLARVLSWSRQYAASIEAYNELLRESPDNLDALRGLERDDEWSGQLKEALGEEKRLLALAPANAQDQTEMARIELLMKDDGAAEATLARLIREHPHNRWARIQLAQLEVRQGRLSDALADYQTVLTADFTDRDALYGAARVDTFLGRFSRAAPLASRLVSERPSDFDALLLYARIENACGKRKQALDLVRRASLVNANSPELHGLKSQIQNENRVTVHTSSSYARELANQNAFVTPAGIVFSGRTVEDLNSMSSAIRTNFSLLPRTDSYVLLAAMPSNSPSGGIQGAVAPAEMMYGQTTRLSNFITVRGGVGGVRMGPGVVYNLGGPAPLVTTSGIVAVGYVGASLFPNPRVSFDFSAARRALTYTPTSVRFGAMETRIEAGIHLAINSQTHASLAYFHAWDSSPVYDEVNVLRLGVAPLERNGRDLENGGSLTVDYGLIRSERFSLDAGYSGMAMGYAGARRGVFMGFFNPAFYQRHLLTSRAYGTLWGPVQYTFTGDVGLQQANEGAPFTRALEVGPGLILRVNRSVSLTFGYLHYDFAQSLGNVRGNSLSLGTDWRF